MDEVDRQLSQPTGSEVCKRYTIEEYDHFQHESNAGGLTTDQKIFELIALGEMNDYMNLSLLCQEHSKPCRMCASSKILWNEKPIHGAIAQRIAEIIQAVPCGMDTYSISGMDEV